MLIVPLLPGLSIYRGPALLAEGEDGVLDLASAGATVVALASGVILGQYLAHPVRREDPLGKELRAHLVLGPLRKRPGRRGEPPTGPHDGDRTEP